MAKILIVDDEKLIVKGLRFSLEQEGYQVDCAYDGEEAVRMAGSTDYDLMLLDLMLPRISGLEVCQQVREFSDVPIIMVTAKGEDMDKIMGLEYGADDYVTKPFNILEVKARIKAILRRTASRGTVREAEKPDVVVSGDLKLYREDRRFEIEEREIKLTSKEFELLDLLMTHPGKVYGREKLLQLVWGADFPGDERTVDVQIARLRDKLGAWAHHIETVRGIGYRVQG